MALPVLTGTITAAQMQQGMNDEVATLNSTALQGKESRTLHIDGVGLTSGTDRQMDFTPSDDFELLVLGLSTNNGTSILSGPVVGLHLDEAAGTTRYLLDRVWKAEITTDGTAAQHERVSYEAATEQLLMLSRGVTYRLRLTLSSGGPIDRAYGWLALRTRRRRR